MYEFDWSGKIAAEPASRPHVINKGQVQYALMDLTTSDRREYYNGFANRALWPTMHYRVGLSDFSRTDYDGYRRVNHNFATALAPLSCPDDLVWVHDYHLIPLAEELRALGLVNAIGYFHHIPWPAPVEFVAPPLRKWVDVAKAATRPSPEGDLIHRYIEGYGFHFVPHHLGSGFGKPAEPCDECGAPDVEIIPPSPVQEIPKDLRAGLSGSMQHREEARPIVMAGHFFDELPSQAITDSAYSVLRKGTVVGSRVRVVIGGCKKVQTAPVPPAVR